MVATKAVNNQGNITLPNPPKEPNWLERIIEWIFNFLGLSDGKAAQKACVVAQAHFEVIAEEVAQPAKSRLPAPIVIAGIPEEPVEPKDTIHWLRDLDQKYSTAVLIDVLGFKRYDAYVENPVISEADYCALVAKCEKVVRPSR